MPFLLAHVEKLAASTDYRHFPGRRYRWRSEQPQRSQAGWVCCVMLHLLGPPGGNRECAHRHLPGRCSFKACPRGWYDFRSFLWNAQIIVNLSFQLLPLWNTGRESRCASTTGGTWLGLKRRRFVPSFLTFCFPPQHYKSLLALSRQTLAHGVLKRQENPMHELFEVFIARVWLVRIVAIGT